MMVPTLFLPLVSDGNRPSTSTTLVDRHSARRTQWRRNHRKYVTGQRVKRWKAVISRVDQAKPFDQPICVKAPVVRGFERGSRQLGFPTANLCADAPQVSHALEQLPSGVYYGYAAFADSTEPSILDWYRAVANLGTVPTFRNSRPSFEVHLMHQFKSDFYGRIISVALVGWLRGETRFTSIDELVSNIQNDIHVTHQLMQSGPNEQTSHLLLSI